MRVVRTQTTPRIYTIKDRRRPIALAVFHGFIFTMSRTEALAIADALVDAAEKEHHE